MKLTSYFKNTSENHILSSAASSFSLSSDKPVRPQVDINKLFSEVNVFKKGDSGSLCKEQLEEEAKAIEATLKWIPPRPSTEEILTASAYRLKKPVVIPRVCLTSRLETPLPFLRAYSPALPPSVTREDFLAFLDNLTIIQSHNVPLQALDLAGWALGCVPCEWSMIAGAGISALALIGRRALSAVRTKTYLEKANECYFGPRGLKVGIMKDEDVARLAQFPKDQDVLAKLDIESGVITLRDRRMKALEPYVAPLVMAVEPGGGMESIEKGWTDKISEWEIKFRVNLMQKNEARKRQNMHVRKERVQRIRKYGYEEVLGEDDETNDYVEGGSILDPEFLIESLEAKIRGLEQKIEQLRQEASDEQKSGFKLVGSKESTEQKIAKAEDRKRKLEGNLSQKLLKGIERGQKAQVDNEKKLLGMEYIVITNYE